MAGKVKSSKTPAFARGGSTKMFGKQSVGTKTPGVTGKADSGGGKWAKGGGTKMFGKQSATAAKKR